MSAVNVGLLISTLVNRVIIYETFDRRQLKVKGQEPKTMSLYSSGRYENAYLYNFGTMKCKYTFLSD